jgi:peptidoglycan/LPS O-acetylase OafA/YrhL
LNHRIRVLDGYRAMAIGMVVLYHYFAKWTPPDHATNLYPYNAIFRDAFSYGYLGVNFFFIISGFVIGMTLTNCSTPIEFFIRRFARLWPAMLACSIITFVGLSLLPAAPFEARFRDLMPGLIFTSPQVLNAALGTDLQWLDGAYWSLFVEVSFYVWAAFLFFSFRKWFGLAFLCLLALSLVPMFLEGSLRSIATIGLVANYIPWFCAGIGFYLLHAQRDKVLGFLLVFASAALLAFHALRDAELGELSFTAAFFGAFLIFVHRPAWVSVFSLRPLTVVGEASYSLYLLHQFLGVSLIAHFAEEDGAWTVLYAIAVLTGMIIASVAIYRYWEVPVKRAVLTAFRSKIPAAA